MTAVFFFYAVSTLMIGAAIAVVASRRPLYSVLSLLVAMFCLAALFVMLEAYVVAVLQILLYAGAVLVLFLFVIMLLNLEPEPRARFRIFTRRTIGMVAGALLVGCLARAFLGAGGGPTLTAVPVPDGTVEAIGRRLFTDYLLPFELMSFLILAAILGAVQLSHQRTE